VDIHLRLPTYFCAPNFAYLMVADAVKAVQALPEVGDVRVTLDDHFASDEINGATAAGRGFDAAFPGESVGELGELRDLFTRKAFTARQSRLCDALLRAGRDRGGAGRRRLGTLDGHPDVTRCIELPRAARHRHPRRIHRRSCSPTGRRWMLRDWRASCASPVWSG